MSKEQTKLGDATSTANTEAANTQSATTEAATKASEDIIAAAHAKAAQILKDAELAADVVMSAQLKAEQILSDANVAASKMQPKPVEAVDTPARTLPDYYSGKVRGAYFCTSHHPQINPFDHNMKFSAAGDGISNARVGEIKANSWLDAQLQAGVIVFNKEA